MRPPSTPSSPFDRPLARQVWFVDLTGSKESEQEGSRPAVVVNRDGTGKQHDVFVIVPVTSEGVEVKRKWRGVTILQAREGNGLKLPSAVLGFQVRALARGRFLYQMGTLDAVEWSLVVKALGDVFPSILTTPPPTLTASQ
jgi:mRNA-degrading endonuclease toxin of MazEF toxin-antitoxin module